MIVKILLLAVTIFYGSSADGVFHSESGPWVIPTSGEVWPMPKRRELRDVYLLLRPSIFRINVIGETCDIVEDAVQRYLSIVLTEARIAKMIVDQDHQRIPLIGTLDSLNVRLLQPCGPNEKNEKMMPYLYMNETYVLDVNDISAASLEADSVWGILRGLETFSQLLTPYGNGPVLKIRSQRIEDSPKLPYRGLLLDTSRHFLPVSVIQSTLDAMSYNKYNVFHWHIVDDNSFPYQSTRYPTLSAKGAYHPKMIYTQDDIEKIIEYARLRGIRVIPEFDTPGHTKSWGLAFPQLLTTCYDVDGKPNGQLGPMDPTNPEVYLFLRGLFGEVAQVFPDATIHLGGDEVPFDCWESNPNVRAYMLAHNMSTDYALLESDYIGKVLRITDKLQAKTIVWQEVFENGVVLPPTTAIHVWTGRWENILERATRAGHPVLLSACWYLDHIAGGGNWHQFYLCDPLAFPAPSKAKKLMLGGEACMWGEFVDKTNVQQRIWPRASAAAERLWSFEADLLDHAAQRLEEHACRMNKRGIPTQPPNGPGFCVM